MFARLFRHPLTTALILLLVGGCSLMFRVLGLDRSLWLDEAWVANSVMAESLNGMFGYEASLQVSPPLFLMLIRTTVQLLGLSATVLRMVPWLLGMVSVVGMFLLARRVVSARFSRLAIAIVALSPIAIEYAKNLKQFTTELAVTTILLLLCVEYLRTPSARRFQLLLAAVAIAPLLAYSVAFLLPGIILAVAFAARRPESPRTNLLRAGLLALVGGIVFAAVYVFFIAPNTEPALKAFWHRNHGGRSLFEIAQLDAAAVLRQLPLPGFLMARPGLSLFAAGTLWLSGLALAIGRFRRGRPRWLGIQLLCALPCLLLIASTSLELYPMNERLSLFLLAPLALLLLSSAQLTTQFVMARRGSRSLTPLIDVTLIALTAGVLWQSVARQPLATIEVPREDAAAAVMFLGSYAQEADLIWVHTSAAETFRLYQKMNGWTGSQVRFGNTGWPCCPRGIAAGWGSGNEGAARADLASAIPPNYEGKVWMLHTGRMDHWRFLGLDESRVAENVMTERGCEKRPAPKFHNMLVSLYSCRVVR